MFENAWGFKDPIQMTYFGVHSVTIDGITSKRLFGRVISDKDTKTVEKERDEREAFNNQTKHILYLSSYSPKQLHIYSLRLSSLG